MSGTMILVLVSAWALVLGYILFVKGKRDWDGKPVKFQDLISGQAR